MDMEEQIFLLSEGAAFRKASAKDACIFCWAKETSAKLMGFHCNWGKEVATAWEQLSLMENMPFMFFKKIIELNLNSFYKSPYFLQ